MSVDRKSAMKAALVSRTRESYEKREDSGQFKSFFVDSSDLKFWKVVEGPHLIDVLPYKAGPSDPQGTKEGDWTYVMIIWVHYGVGVNQDSYVCPARNFNLPCPICEYREEIRRQEDYDEDLVKELTPKRRSIYWVVCYDSEKEEAKGPQIFDVAHWYMEKYLVSLAKTPERGGQKAVVPYIPFSDIDEGKTISFEKKGQKRNTEYVGHKFIDRNYVLPFELVDTLLPLDSLVKICDYDTIKAAFYGGADGGELAPPPPVAEAPAPTPPVAAPALAIRKRIAPVAAETSAPVPIAVTPPTPKVATPVVAPVVGANTCPVGGVFGQDCEQLEACSGCVNWNPCSELADQIAAESQGAPIQTPPVAPPAQTPRVARPPIAAGAPAPAPRPAVRPPVAAPAGAPSPGPAGPRRIPRK